MFNKDDPQEVLASWLFAQYLLSNEVQIAYSQTEGYIPVTSKAQKDEAYQDYLSRAGEDNSTYYDVKINAAELLLDHMEDTFVTPVFNGSVSLRDAAGQMIENVTKSVRRKAVVDEAYMEDLFGQMVSLYHLNLDGSGGLAGGKKELGALPAEARALIICLILAWAGMGAYLLCSNIRKRRRRA